MGARTRLLNNIQKKGAKSMLKVVIDDIKGRTTYEKSFKDYKALKAYIDGTEGLFIQSITNIAK